MTFGRVKNTHGADEYGGTMDLTESYLWVSGPEWPVPPGRVTRIESRSSSTACLVFQGAVPAALCLHCQLEFLIKLDTSGESMHTAKQGRCRSVGAGGTKEAAAPPVGEVPSLHSKTNLPSGSIFFSLLKTYIFCCLIVAAIWCKCKQTQQHVMWSS